MKGINDSRTYIKVKVSSGRWSRGTDLLNLNHCIKWQWVVNITPRPLPPAYTARYPVLCLTGVRTPNRTVRSESLYQTRYPGPPMEIYATVKLALPFLLESPPSLLLRRLTISRICLVYSIVVLITQTGYRSNIDAMCALCVTSSHSSGSPNRFPGNTGIDFLHLLVFQLQLNRESTPTRFATNSRS